MITIRFHNYMIFSQFIHTFDLTPIVFVVSRLLRHRFIFGRLQGWLSHLSKIGDIHSRTNTNSIQVVLQVPSMISECDSKVSTSVEWSSTVGNVDLMRYEVSSSVTQPYPLKYLIGGQTHLIGKCCSSRL